MLAEIPFISAELFPTMRAFVIKEVRDEAGESYHTTKVKERLIHIGQQHHNKSCKQQPISKNSGLLYRHQQSHPLQILITQIHNTPSEGGIQFGRMDKKSTAILSELRCLAEKEGLEPSRQF